ncbi:MULTISPECIES: alpha/beta fold hydrolase [Thalassotalea]|uniref:Alpha/beta fold hydrolase n=1 Tax=Thalassotalea castellviae TaxID=3075612 RepID=A0ABU3A2T8_9GAMM|nr:alpha/beta fold hydrolase [Thalassotalea sp. W431]MDT0604491.1 alpha/beta fold hydrolase [Thalassotalea sp. W431]
MALLNYQQSGEGENLVLIHGLFGSLENLNMVAKTLNQDFCVTNLDVRNHGLSFHENNMEYPTLALDIIDTLDHLNIESTHLLGHSMGGKIAMQVALDFPERVNKLIVADISPVQYPQHHDHIITGLQSIDLSKITNRKQADEQLAQYVDDKGVRQFLLRNLHKVADKLAFKCNLSFIAQCYPQIIKGYQGSHVFQKPTLFIKGGDSDYITEQHRPIIRQLFPHSKAKIIQGTGHWLHAEKTAAFNNSVKSFLSQEA